MIIVYQNGSRNSVLLNPSLIEVGTPLQEEYNQLMFNLQVEIEKSKTWYDRKEAEARKQFFQDSVDGILMGTPTIMKHE